MLNQYIQKLSHPTNATPEEIPLEQLWNEREDAQLLFTSKALANISEAQSAQIRNYGAGRSHGRSIDDLQDGDYVATRKFNKAGNYPLKVIDFSNL